VVTAPAPAVDAVLPVGPVGYGERVVTPAVGRSSPQLLRFSTTVQRLSADQLATRLSALPGWRVDGDALVKDLAPRGFKRAIALAIEIAAQAHVVDHHPDLSLGFGRLEVRLTTHDAGGISARDVELAASIEAAVAAANAASPPKPSTSPAPTTTPTTLTVAPLPDAARAALPTTVPAWQVEHDTLVRRVPLPFLQAAALLDDIAALAKQHDHHPDVELAGGQLVVKTTTHDAGGLSHLDVALAQAIDALLT
jgi:4a-hydroxytetrahydrobiopterin dehydratase